MWKKQSGRLETSSSKTASRRCLLGSNCFGERPVLGRVRRDPG